MEGGKKKGGRRRASGLRLSALTLLLFLSFCSVNQKPLGFSGWFSASSPEGNLKGRFHYLPGEFLRVEAGGCSFIIEPSRVRVYDHRRKEMWEGPWEKVRERFPELPGLNEMGEIWRGKGVIKKSSGGWPTLFLFKGWSVRLLKVKRGASLGEKHDYKKVRFFRICSRFVQRQK